jgi:quercetin dioxygenase-like cupin family protein
MDDQPSDLGAFRVFNVPRLLNDHPARTNFNVFRLDDRYNLRVAKVTGRFPWHRHPNGDEGWLVLQGSMRIDVQDRPSIVLRALEGTMIPRGTVHSPLALEEETLVAVFNIAGFEHEFVEEQPEVGAFSESDLTQ